MEPFTIPTDAPEVGRHVRVGHHHTRRRASHRRRTRPAWATPTPTRPPRADPATLAEWSPGATRWTSPRAWRAMGRAVRNLGPPGIASMAIVRGGHRALGSEGAAARPAAGRRCWARCATACPSMAAAASRPIPRAAAASNSAAGSASGIRAREDEDRPRPGRRSWRGCSGRAEAIGADAELFVDANGAYGRKQALAHGRALRRAAA